MMTFPCAATMYLHCSAKNHISTWEPYFALFYHNNVQRVEANFSHFFYRLEKNVLEFHWHKRNKSVSVKMQKLQEIKNKWRNIVTWRNMVLCSTCIRTHFYDVSALVACWSSVSISRIIYIFLNVFLFYFTAFVVSEKVWYPYSGLTTAVWWLLLIQLTLLSRTAAVTCMLSTFWWSLCVVKWLLNFLLV